MSTIVTRAGKGSPLTNNEVDANFVNLNTDKIESITSVDGSVTVTPTGTTRDLSVAVSGSTTNVIVLVRNTTGATLTKGTAVYISGATGQNPTVSKAIATGDPTSAQTLGLMTADLANNTNGYVTVIGLITNIDTSAYTDGAQLYLSGTTAGTLTATKPYAPIHLVYAAVVEHAHPSQGKLFVKVQNGYEMDELHNVSAQSPTTGQTLVYNASNSLWEKNTVSLTTGVTGTLPTANGGTNLTSFTSGGVVYASSSSALATGSALTFDGSVFGLSVATGIVKVTSTTGTNAAYLYATNTGGDFYFGKDNSTGGTFGSGSAYSAVLYSAGAYPMVFFTNAAEKMRLDSSGNLGIGTNSPSAKLTVSSTYVSDTTVQTRFSDNTGGRLEFGGNASGGKWINANDSGTATAVPLIFQNGSNVERMRLDSAGNVGIGTSSPSSYGTRLVVSGAASVYGDERKVLALNDTTALAAGVGAGISFYGVSESGGGNSQFASIKGIKENATAANYAGALAFVTSTSANVQTERMRLDSAGNLGLGVTPSTAWASSAYLAAQFGFGGVIMSSQVSTNTSVFNIGANFKYDGSDYRRINGEEASQYQQVSGTHNWRIAGSSTANSVISWTQAMTLDASGNLGVGTTNPVYKLEVGNGTAGAVMRLNNVGGTNAGAYIRFDKASVQKNLIGTLSGVISGLSDDLAYWSVGGAGHQWYVNGAVTSSMVLDVSGNLGIGTSSPAGKLQVGVNDSSIILDNVYSAASPPTTGNNQYIFRDTNDGSLNFSSRPGGGGNYKFWNGATQLAIITNAGNVGIGTSSPASGVSSTQTVLEIANGNVAALALNNTAAKKFTIYSTVASSLVFSDVTAGVNRMGIDTSGNLLVGTSFTTTYAACDGKISVLKNSASTASPTLAVLNADASAAFVAFSDTATVFGSITRSVSAVLYNTTSDQRLKENIQDADSASSLIDSLQVRKFDWKTNGSHQRYGFVAQELVTVAPEAVYQPNDADAMMAVDYSKLVPMLVKEIQSLRKRLADAGI